MAMRRGRLCRPESLVDDESETITRVVPYTRVSSDRQDVDLSVARVTNVHRRMMELGSGCGSLDMLGALP